MASTGVVNGTNLRLYLSGSAVAYATSCTLTVNRELRETIHKDNPGSGWREVEVGQKSGTMTVEALYSDDGANNTADVLFDALNAGTALSAELSTQVSGDDKYNFTCYCTSWEATGPVEENATFSCSFEIDGAITRGSIT
jgi:TP901-1 family phage major tail protein